MKHIKCETGEIWIRFESMEEYKNNYSKMTDCIFKNTDKRFNTCKIIVYVDETRATQQLCDYCMYESLQALRGEFGEANVVFAGERTVNICDREFKDSENIERIADAMEGIRECLERIADCCGCPEPQWFNNLKHAAPQEVSE